MKSRKSFLFNFLIRVLVCFALIFVTNQILEWREIPVSVGINGISFLVSGMLGVPGVAMLYGMVACVFL